MRYFTEFTTSGGDRPFFHQNSDLIRPSLVLVLILWGCSHPDYAIPLPHGYELVRGNDVDIFISGAGPSVVVHGTITGYAVIAHRFVVGREDTAKMREKNGDSPLVGKGGWFILDTEARTVQTELTETDWKEKVSALAGGKIPELKVPD